MNELNDGEQQQLPYQKEPVTSGSVQRSGSDQSNFEKCQHSTKIDFDSIFL